MSRIDHPLNKARQKLEAGELALGLIMRLVRNAEAGVVAAASDHDFILIDGQHVAMSLDTIVDMIAGAVSAGVAAIVRVRGYNDPNIPLFLDAGASGIVAPNVNSVREAKTFVQTARFAPLGSRSMPGPVGYLAYEAISDADTAALVDAQILLFCMIETEEGLRAHADIAAVEGIDGLHIGALDLLSSMGDGLTLADLAFKSQILRVITSCREVGKVCGIGGDRDSERVAEYIRAGARMLTSQIDAALLIAAAKNRSGELRQLRKP